MLLRSLLVLFIMSLPLAASADQASASVPSTAGVSQSGSDASDLGPAASGAAGSSTADGGSLQPAGISPLQSTTGDSSGLTAPTANTLQEPVAPGASALQVIAGDADGPTYDPAASGSNWGWLGFSLFFGFIAIALLLVTRRRPHIWLHMRTRVAKLSMPH